MTLYAKVKLRDGVEEFVEEVAHDPLTPGMIKKLANGRPALRPIQVLADPPFDADTQKLSPFSYQVLANKVQRSRRIVVLTQAELAARNQEKDAAAAARVVDPFIKILIKWLAGKFGIPTTQARDEIKALYRAQL